MYDYLLLLTASWLGYRGASAAVIIVVTMLLSLPRLVKDANAGALSLGTLALTANATLFAGVAYMVGFGVRALIWPA